MEYEEIFLCRTIHTLFTTEADVEPMSALTEVACDGGRLKAVLSNLEPLPKGVGIFCCITGTAMFLSN
jgi:hypothetical protein